MNNYNWTGSSLKKCVLSKQKSTQTVAVNHILNYNETVSGKHVFRLVETAQMKESFSTTENSLMNLGVII